MIIRAATDKDCAAIADLWNPVIRDSDVTFNTHEKTAGRLVADIADKATKHHPFLVAEGRGGVLGFTTYGQFRASNGYRHTMEHTIILSPDAQGIGLGRKLMHALENHARDHRVHSMFAGISQTNQAAIAFHASLGYVEVARLPEVGFKFNRWYGLVLMQKIL